MTSDKWFYHYIMELSEENVITGYPNGNYGPYDTTTTGAAVTLLMRAVGAPEQPAADNHWAGGFINYAHEKGFLDKDRLGNYDGNISRVKIAEIAAKSLGLAKSKSKSPYIDVDNGYVTALYEAGIVMGDSDTTFSPQRNVTREEITVMVVRALQYADLRCPFRDEENIADKDTVSDWAKDAYEYIGVNYVSDYEGEDTDRPYRMLYPQKAATRYDIAYILDNTLKNCQLFATDLAVAYGFDQQIPIIDGSTSTYPFTEQVYRALFVNGTTHPQYPRKHSKSHTSYERLINGEVDMLFASVYPASDILALAEERV